MKQYDDSQVQLYCKSSLDMSELSDESVQCVVTSPPYWGLRKYSGEQEINEWGCAFGLEPTPEMYVEHTILFLQEIRRVLRKDGVVFWNIGDSYNSKEPSNGRSFRRDRDDVMPGSNRGGHSNNLKPKDLCLIPFRVALASQGFATVSADQIWMLADWLAEARQKQDWEMVELAENTLRTWAFGQKIGKGWWVRSVIIWSKPNPMPESVKDRPAGSHEYILMLTKSAKYYWDADAVREPQQLSSLLRATRGWEGDTNRDYPHGPQSHIDRYFNKSYEEAMSLPGRNIRTVWEFPTQPYPEAHFAVFPEALPTRCIMAATPPKCCAECGAPWGRVTERVGKGWDGSKYGERAVEASGGAKSGGTKQSTLGSSHGQLVGSQKTRGWQPTCSCNADTKPSLVLDPFAGAGTTLAVAKKLGREAVGYDLSGEYCQLAIKRVSEIPTPMEMGI